MAKIAWDSDELGKVLKSKGLRKFLQDKADQVAEAARSSAPSVSGEYRASIKSEVVEHPTRIVGRVTADVPYAFTVEANTGNLARALDAAKGR